MTELSKGRYELKAPTSVEAGLVEVRLKKSAKAPADAQIYRVEGEHSAKELVEKALESPDGAPTPAWAHAAGGAGRTAPGKTGFAAQILGPATTFSTPRPAKKRTRSPTPRTEESPRSRSPARRMARSRPPTPRITAGAPKEYRFTSTGLEAGTNRLTYDNKGEQAHHVVAFPFREGATLEQVKRTFHIRGRAKGPTSVDFERSRSTAVTDGGTKIVTDLELERGRYALVCFISDRKGGPPHVAKGMIAEAKIK